MVANVAALAAETPAWAGSVDTSISITGLHEGDSVDFYKVLAYDQNARAAVADATDPTVGAGSWKAVAPFASMTLADFKAILSTGITSAIAGRLGAMATSNVAYTEVANASGVATHNSPDAGLYIAIITPAAGTDTTYNPVFVGADYYSNTDPNHANTWAVTGNMTYADSAMAKSSTVTLEKTAQDERTIDDNNEETVSVGDTITFTVTTTIPGFADNYTNPVFKLTDKLSDGLTLNISSVTVDVPAGLSKGTGAEDEYNVVATTKTVGGETVTDGYVLAFAADYLKTVKTATPVTVTYTAVVNSAALDSVNPEDNTVTLNYSTSPDDTEGHGIKRDKTNHYSFDIDANLFGEDDYKASEVVKVGVDKDGNEITQTIQLDNTHWIGALANAKFKLYKDNNGEKGAAYTNKFYTADSVFVSDANGRLKLEGASEQGIRGLDAGTYWLEEIEAPAGYIKLQNAVKIEIIANVVETTYTDTETINGQSVEVTYKADELRSYQVKIGDVETADYSMTNNPAVPGSIAKSDKGDTVVGGTDSESGKPSTDKKGKLQNTQGVELPSTGGMGTTILYVGGSILVILAAILLITKRRMNAED